MSAAVLMIAGILRKVTVFSLYAIVCLVVYAVSCLGKARMFSKAGEKGWKAWVPFYRMYIMSRLCIGKGWYFVFGFIPVLRTIIRVFMAIDIPRAYIQRENRALIGALYFFVPVIAEYIIGFGDAYYLAPEDLVRQLKILLGGLITNSSPEKSAGEDGTSATDDTLATDSTASADDTAVTGDTAAADNTAAAAVSAEEAEPDTAAADEEPVSSGEPLPEPADAETEAGTDAADAQDDLE